MGAWLFIVLVFSFILFWCGLLTLLGWLSGWQALAQRYRAHSRPEGTAFSWLSGRVGRVNYGNCLNVRVAEEGLYLEMAWLFRIGHPALLLPWGDLHVAEVGKSWGFAYAALNVGDPAAAGRLRLPLRVLEAARQLVPAGSAGSGSDLRSEERPPVEWQVTRTRLGTWRRCTRPDGTRFAEFVAHARLFGLPLLHYTFGIHPETGRRVVARGIVAVGRLAVGVVALGQASAGAIALGQASLGLALGLGQATVGAVAVGQLALGAVIGVGQFATGYFALGQFAAGVEAAGQVAVRL